MLNEYNIKYIPYKFNNQYIIMPCYVIGTNEVVRNSGNFIFTEVVLAKKNYDITLDNYPKIGKDGLTCINSVFVREDKLFDDYMFVWGKVQQLNKNELIEKDNLMDQVFDIDNCVDNLKQYYVPVYINNLGFVALPCYLINIRTYVKNGEIHQFNDIVYSRSLSDITKSRLPKFCNDNIFCRNSTLINNNNNFEQLFDDYEIIKKVVNNMNYKNLHETFIGDYTYGLDFCKEANKLIQDRLSKIGDMQIIIDNVISEEDLNRKRV